MKMPFEVPPAWIPASTPPAAIDKDFLVSFGGGLQQIAHLGKDGRWHHQGKFVSGVTHWMPLPKAPSPSED